MIKPLSYAPGVRARLQGYGFDRELQDSMATQIGFKKDQFVHGQVLSIQHAGLIFRIEGSCIRDFRFPNPHEFDAEGCQEFRI